jgi:hypothetical protein
MKLSRLNGATTALALTAVLAGGGSWVDASASCDDSGCYRKAISSANVWTGIEAVVTLPNFDLDVSSAAAGRGETPSVYLNSLSGSQEVSCGLAWSAIREPNGIPSKEAKAFRPFWKTDEWHEAPQNQSFNYYPGDTVRIRLETTETNRMSMHIELLQRPGMIAVSKQADSKKPNSLTGFITTSSDAVTSFSGFFRAEGFGPGQVQEFARVISTVLPGTKGRESLAPLTRIGVTEWKEVWLLRDHERVAMSPEQLTGIQCPDAELVSVAAFGASGEQVAIRTKK